MISRMRDADIGPVVDLHLRELAWTLNARMGREHLTRLYAATLASPSSRCFVSAEGERLLGFATAAVDLAEVERAVMGSLTLAQKTRIGAFILARPERLGWYLDSLELGRVRGTDNIPYLLTIGVDTGAARRGIGSALLHSVEAALAEAGKDRIYVDYSRTNAAAESFYRSNGFEHLESSRKSVLCVKQLTPVAAQ